MKRMSRKRKGGGREEKGLKGFKTRDTQDSSSSFARVSRFYCSHGRERFFLPLDNSAINAPISQAFCDL